ncbi:MAG: Gfo/Idh/MocA family oxidoreductase [Natronohydrobacter sp.]|nr:Gfo/Idh/MocA family oxidoreductase [Natronohydrobacter sp.]
MVTGAILVIGAGSIGRRHFDNLTALGVRAELHGWRSFDRAAVAMRDDVAGIVIATATPIRLELIELCAAKGWPFYAEKPLAWRVNQARAIHDAAAPVAARSLVGFMMRWHPVVRALAAMDVSDVFRIHAEIGHDVRQWRANWRFGDSYAARAEGGGVLLDLCHEIDLVAALFPGLMVHDVRALGHEDFPGVDFATSLHVSTASGAAGQIAMDYLAPVFTRKLTLSGLSRRIEADLLASRITIHSADGSQTQDYPFERNSMFLDAMRAFLGLIAGQNIDDPLLPRLDRMDASSLLIARAWETRQFQGAISLDMS